MKTIRELVIAVENLEEAVEAYEAMGCCLAAPASPRAVLYSALRSK